MCLVYVCLCLGFGFGATTGTSGGGLFGGGGSSLFQTPQTSNAFGAKTTGFGGNIYFKYTHKKKSI